MDRSYGNVNDNSLTKEEQENEANAAIEAEMRDATEAANQLDDEMQNTEGGDNPLVLVGKRPGELNSTEDQQPPKKPKLEENQTQDVASAAPSQESNKKKKQVSFKTPPGTPKASTAPVTPSGKHLNQSPDQGNSPVGPTVDSFLARDTNSVDASGSETETDIDEEFAKMCAKEAEGAIDEDTSSEGSPTDENL